LHSHLRHFPAFSPELRGVGQFDRSGVLYLALGNGFQDLQHLHAHLNCGTCHASETWDYHPHVTLAQALPAEAMEAGLEHCVRAWREFTGPRSFLVDRLTFVQNVAEENREDRWADLEEFALQPAVPVGR
jgi:2'-5' RNA ligase